MGEISRMTVKQMLMLMFLVAGQCEEMMERRVHPSLLTSCIAEQLGSGLDSVRKCLACFEEVGDALSQEGLVKAQACTDAWLPREAADCSAELSALKPDDMEASEKVIACFANVRYIMSAEDCLQRNGENGDVIETLTDGVLCLQSSHNNLTAVIHKIFENQIKEEFQRVQEYIKDNNIPPPPPPKKDPLEEQLASLVFKRHCIIASQSADEEQDCNKCFSSHLNGNINQLVSPEDHFKSLAACSTTHLSPRYDTCTGLLNDLIQNPKANRHLGHDIFLCFTRVVTQYQVEECSEGIEEVNAEMLLEVMECGTHSVNTWVMENVSLPPPPPPPQEI